jgi:hypothetical protein
VRVALKCGFSYVRDFVSTLHVHRARAANWRYHRSRRYKLNVTGVPSS